MKSSVNHWNVPNTQRYTYTKYLKCFGLHSGLKFFISTKVILVYFKFNFWIIKKKNNKACHMADVSFVSLKWREIINKYCYYFIIKIFKALVYSKNSWRENVDKKINK